MAICDDCELNIKIADLSAPQNAFIASSGNDWRADAVKRLEPHLFRLLFLAADRTANKVQQELT